MPEEGQRGVQRGLLLLPPGHGLHCAVFGLTESHSWDQLIPAPYMTQVPWERTGVLSLAG